MLGTSLIYNSYKYMFRFLILKSVQLEQTESTLRVPLQQQCIKVIYVSPFSPQLHPPSPKPTVYENFI